MTENKRKVEIFIFIVSIFIYQFMFAVEEAALVICLGTSIAHARYLITCVCLCDTW